jgi:ribosomal-protein-alanine N-acetyltransferase
MTFDRVDTDRLALRRPLIADASAMFLRYAGDHEVTRFMSWPTHRSVDDTRAFIEASDAEWDRSAMGPYLIESRESGELLGSTGLALESPDRAATGYVLAKDAWGLGYASEALGCVVRVAAEMGLRRLYALCHPEHAASARVLEKCGFTCEGLLPRRCRFPNLQPGDPGDAVSYARAFDQGQSGRLAQPPSQVRHSRL